MVHCVYRTGPTHRMGGTLNVVITHRDLPAPVVEVVDTGLSDHFLLLCPLPTPTATTCCQVRRSTTDTVLTHWVRSTSAKTKVLD